MSSFLEQCRNERGGSAGSLCPVRVVLDGDQFGVHKLYEECLVEDTTRQESEFPYQSFLSMLHKRIRTKLTA